MITPLSFFHMATPKRKTIGNINIRCNQHKWQGAKPIISEYTRENSTAKSDTKKPIDRKRRFRNSSKLFFLGPKKRIKRASTDKAWRAIAPAPRNTLRLCTACSLIIIARAPVRSGHWKTLLRPTEPERNYPPLVIDSRSCPQELRAGSRRSVPNRPGIST